MVRECLHIFSDGRHCANPPRREKLFCRHHENPLQPDAVLNTGYSYPEDPSDTFVDQPVLIQHWRDIGVLIPRMSLPEMEDAFSEILAALADDAISYRCAGRFIQLIIRRTEVLQAATP
jgi:hypothetical protein